MLLGSVDPPGTHLRHLHGDLRHPCLASGPQNLPADPQQEPKSQLTVQHPRTVSVGPQHHHGLALGDWQQLQTAVWVKTWQPQSTAYAQGLFPESPTSRGCCLQAPSSLLASSAALHPAIMVRSLSAWCISGEC